MYADGGNPVYREPKGVNGGCLISVSYETFKAQLNSTANIRVLTELQVGDVV